MPRSTVLERNIFRSLSSIKSEIILFYGVTMKDVHFLWCTLPSIYLNWNFPFHSYNIQAHFEPLSFINCNSVLPAIWILLSSKLFCVSSSILTSPVSRIFKLYSWKVPFVYLYRIMKWIFTCSTVFKIFTF